jgi:hypothetical protein
MSACWQDKFVVQLQSQHCRTSYWCQPDDFNTIVAPAKVIGPTLGSRVEQGHLFSCLWINGVRLGSFVTVAPSAGQPQVGLVGSAPTREGYNVLDVHLSATNFLRCQAITTAMLGLGCDSAA